MAAGTTPEGDEILIKKYSNRRLYDTQQSRYITLEDLAGLIRGGATVRVVDAKSGEDLTRVVLTQVILEEQDRLDLLPVELLHHVIKTQGTMLQGPFATFLSMSMKQFLSTGQMWERQVQGLVQGMGVPGMAGMPGMADVFGGGPSARGKGSATAGAKQPPQPDRDGPAAGDDAAPAGADGGDPDLDAMRSRMEALLGRLKK